MSLQDIPPKRRWPRSQKFSLSPAGREAENEYRSTIVAARTEGGRASFDAARADWAKRRAIQPDDGLYLSEVSAEPKNLQQLVEALESCGKSKTDAIDALGRLVDSGLLTPN